jgi:hypothetical protein
MRLIQLSYIVAELSLQKRRRIVAADSKRAEMGYRPGFSRFRRGAVRQFVRLDHMRRILGF